MTAVPVSHLDAISSIPPGLLYPHQADGCERRRENPSLKRPGSPVAPE